MLNNNSNKIAIVKLTESQIQLRQQLEQETKEEQQLKTINALAAVIFALSLKNSGYQKRSK
jgi:oligoendopeptidase F